MEALTYPTITTAPTKMNLLQYLNNGLMGLHHLIIAWRDAGLKLEGDEQLPGYLLLGTFYAAPHGQFYRLEWPLVSPGFFEDLNLVLDMEEAEERARRYSTVLGPDFETWKIVNDRTGIIAPLPYGVDPNIHRGWNLENCHDFVIEHGQLKAMNLDHMIGMTIRQLEQEMLITGRIDQGFLQLTTLRNPRNIDHTPNEMGMPTNPAGIYYPYWNMARILDHQIQRGDMIDCRYFRLYHYESYRAHLFTGIGRRQNVLAEAAEAMAKQLSILFNTSSEMTCRVCEQKTPEYVDHELRKWEGSMLEVDQEHWPTPAVYFMVEIRHPNWKRPLQLGVVSRIGEASCSILYIDLKPLGMTNSQLFRQVGMNVDGTEHGQSVLIPLRDLSLLDIVLDAVWRKFA